MHGTGHTHVASVFYCLLSLPHITCMVQDTPTSLLFSIVYFLYPTSHAWYRTHPRRFYFLLSTFFTPHHMHGTGHTHVASIFYCLFSLPHITCMVQDTPTSLLFSIVYFLYPTSHAWYRTHPRRFYFLLSIFFTPHHMHGTGHTHVASIFYCLFSLPHITCMVQDTPTSLLFSIVYFLYPTSHAWYRTHPRRFCCLLSTFFTPHHMHGTGHTHVASVFYCLFSLPHITCMVQDTPTSLLFSIVYFLYPTSHAWYRTHPRRFCFLLSVFFTPHHMHGTGHTHVASILVCDVCFLLSVFYCLFSLPHITCMVQDTPTSLLYLYVISVFYCLFSIVYFLLSIFFTPHHMHGTGHTHVASVFYCLLSLPHITCMVQDTPTSLLYLYVISVFYCLFSIVYFLLSIFFTPHHMHGTGHTHVASVFYCLLSLPHITCMVQDTPTSLLFSIVYFLYPTSHAWYRTHPRRFCFLLSTFFTPHHMHGTGHTHVASVFYCLLSLPHITCMVQDTPTSLLYLYVMSVFYCLFSIVYFLYPTSHAWYRTHPRRFCFLLSTFFTPHHMHGTGHTHVASVFYCLFSLPHITCMVQDTPTSLLLSIVYFLYPTSHAWYRTHPRRFCFLLSTFFTPHHMHGTGHTHVASVFYCLFSLPHITCMVQDTPTSLLFSIVYFLYPTSHAWYRTHPRRFCFLLSTFFTPHHMHGTGHTHVASILVCDVCFLLSVFYCLFSIVYFLYPTSHAWYRTHPRRFCFLLSTFFTPHHMHGTGHTHVASIFYCLLSLPHITCMVQDTPTSLLFSIVYFLYPTSHAWYRTHPRRFCFLLSTFFTPHHMHGTGHTHVASIFYCLLSLPHITCMVQDTPTSLLFSIVYFLYPTSHAWYRTHPRRFCFLLSTFFTPHHMHGTGHTHVASIFYCLFSLPHITCMVQDTPTSLLFSIVYFLYPTSHAWYRTHPRRFCFLLSTFFTPHHMHGTGHTHVASVFYCLLSLPHITCMVQDTPTSLLYLYVISVFYFLFSIVYFLYPTSHAWYRTHPRRFYTCM
eukprot:jgi/Mesvir1/17863/Mv25369-RA.1